MVELRLPSRDDLDFCPDRVAIALRALKGEFQPVVASRAVVDPNLRRRAESGYDDVESAIVIEIPNR